MNKKTLTSALCSISIASFALTACGADTEASDTAVATDATTDAEGDTAAETTASAAPSAAGDPEDCPASEGEMIEANHNPGEPTFAIPLPDGWERNTAMDSEIVRLGIAHAESQESFSSAVITAEQTPAPVGEIDLGLDQVAKDGSIQEEDPSTICGFTSQRVDYIFSSPQGEVPATLLAISVPSDDGYTTAALTVQQSDPDAEHYADTKEEILDGFTVVETP